MLSTRDSLQPIPTLEQSMIQLTPDAVNQMVEQAIGFLSVHSLNILIAIAVFIVGRFLSKRLAKVIGAIMTKAGVEEILVGFLRNIIYYALLAAVVVAALGQAGINVTSFLAILGAAGLAIGLALKGTLSNFAAGVMLILLKFFKKGDFITISGQTGTVQSIKTFYTILTTTDNKQIIVPNSSILGSTIINFSANPTRRVDMVFGIGYDDDIAEARRIIEDILDADERILKDPAPVVAVSELADSSVNFTVRSWVARQDYMAVYWALNERVKIAFDQAGISIPYPQRDVHVHQIADQ